ncbi:MAG: nitroreductase family protein [Candidatus Bathyarchaeia archaeon]
MSFIDTVLSRRSIRRYEKQDIPKDVLDKILEAGRQAPSAGNKQPWHFIVLSDYDIKEKLSHGKWNTFVKDSAVTIVGCGYIGDEYGRKWSTVDISIALQNMVIAAWGLGIGSCWIGDFKEAQVKRLLNIPEDRKVIALVTFGYPAEKIESRQKKPMDEIVSYNKF